jgi:hypothetical protein
MDLEGTNDVGVVPYKSSVRKAGALRLDPDSEIVSPGVHL